MGKSQASGIGRGKKTSLHRNVVSPSPNKYAMKSEFDSKSIGGKMGISRQVIQKINLELQVWWNF